MVINEARTLWSLLRGQAAAPSHAARLQRFYAPQADYYDRFRERLLCGRAELIAGLELQAGERVLELGAGTGRNAEYYAARIPRLASVELVDLCPALLERARQRAARWPNVRVIEDDATEYQPAVRADCVYFSYSLTMIPNWSRAIDNALTALRPGGRFGVVDFYVADTRPKAGLTRHGRWTRTFWPWWFKHDGVHLSPRHLSYLRTHIKQSRLFEGMARIPYLPGLRVPYYVFIGTRT